MTDTQTCRCQETRKQVGTKITMCTVEDYQMNLTVGHSEGTTSSNYGVNLQNGPLSMMVMMLVMIMMIVMFLLMLVELNFLDGLFCILDQLPQLPTSRRSPCTRWL